MISEIALGGYGAGGYDERAVQNRILVVERAMELGMNYVGRNTVRECDVCGEGQMDYVAWHIRGRSYCRVFWRFPGGRNAVEEYLEYVREKGVDWEQTARRGYIALKPDVRQIPVGTEAAIVEFMTVLDDRLAPVPTRLVESVRESVYKNVDGTPDPETNTGLGLIDRVYGAQRRLLFDNPKRGGLARAPDDAPAYQVLLSGHKDCGHFGGPQAVVQTCAHCHMHWAWKKGGI